MKLLQKSMILALSALLASETVQAGFTGSARAGGVIKTNVKKALDSYNLTQPNLDALQQMVTDAQSIRPGVTNGYTPKEWESLKLDFVRKTGINIDGNLAITIPALTDLLRNLKTTKNGSIADALAMPTTQGAQKFQAAWQRFLAANSLSGEILPNAQQEASQRLGVTIDTLRGVILERNEEIRDLQNLVQRIQTDLNSTQFDRAALAKDLEIIQQRLAMSVSKNDKDRSDSDQDVQKLRDQLRTQINDLQRKLDLNENILTIAKEKRAEAELQLDACLRDSASQNIRAVLNTIQKQLKGLVTTAKQFPTLFVNTSLVDFTNADLSMSVTNALTKDMSLISGRITTLEAKAKDVAELQKKLDACLAKDSSGVNKAAQEQIAQLQQQLTQTQTTNAQVNQANAQLQKENTELHTALKESANHMAELTAQLQALQTENAQLKNARQGK